MSEMASALGIVFTVLLLTSFVKIITSLTIFRVGIGLNQSGFGIALIAVALALSLITMSPQLSSVGGINGILSGKMPKEAVDYEKNFSPFLEKNSDPQIVERLSKFNKVEVKDKKPFEIVIASFMLTELKEAFQIGLIILIPFLVIDLLVANALILLGANQLSPELVSLPLKIIVFFAVDGWTLLAEKLLRTYL